MITKNMVKLTTILFFLLINSFYTLSVDAFTPRDGFSKTEHFINAEVFDDRSGEVLNHKYIVIHLNATVPKTKQLFERSMLFPPTQTAKEFKQASKQHSQDILSKIIDRLFKEEKYSGKVANYKWVTPMISSVLIPLTPLYCLIVYFRQKKKLNPESIYVPDYAYNLPEKISPGEVATRYFRTRPIEEDFSATLLHLMQKGWLKLETVQSKNSSSETLLITSSTGQTDYPKALLEHEKIVWDYFIGSMKKSSVTIEELNGLSLKDKQFAIKLNNLRINFKNILYQSGKEYRGESFEAQQNLSESILILIPFIVISAILHLIFLPIKSQSYELIEGLTYRVGLFFVVSLIVGIIMASIFIYLMKHHPLLTTIQQEKRDQWLAFRKMLNEIGEFKSRKVDSLALWKEYLIYATSLGVAEQVIDALTIEFDPYRLQSQNNNIHEFYQFIHTKQVLTREVKQTFKKIHSTVRNHSNRNGFGGGFSGGSMGGSGGGTRSGGF